MSIAFWRKGAGKNLSEGATAILTFVFGSSIIIETGKNGRF